MADRNLRLQVILEGLDRITAPLKTITGASSAARRDLARTHEELKSLDALQKQVGSYKAREAAFAADTRKLQETNQRLAELRTQLAATEQPTKKLRAEFERVERQATTLATRLDAGGAELQQLSARLSAAGIDVGDLARHEDRLAERTAQANRSLRQQTDQLEQINRARQNSDKLNDISAKASGVGLGMIAAGAASAAPVIGAVKQAATLESAMADVAKVTNMAAPQIEQLSDDFLDLSETIPLPAHELATIAAAAGAAGVGMDKFGKALPDQRRQLKEFTTDAGEMGVAFDMTANQAGDTMAKWRTAFDLPQAGVRALGDSVNALTNRFGGNAANVAEIVTRIGPLGKVAGLAAPQIAALGSTLDSIGIPGEVAATGIKNTMLALTKGAAATKGQQEAFQALGLDAVGMAKAMQTDAGGAILTVMERLRALPKEAQAGMLTELFGSESVAAIAPLLTNLDGLKQRLALVGDASATAGSMHAEFLNRIATTEGATGLAANALSGLNITMGKALLPTVVKVAGYVKDAASAIRGWAQENPALAKGIMLFMGVGAALLVLVGGLSLAFAALTAAAAPLGIALGPLLLIVAAIAAVAGAAYLLHENWGSVGGIFDPLMASGQALFASIAGMISKVTPLLMLLWNGPLGERIRIVMALMQELAIIVATAIGGTVMDVLSALMTTAGAVFDFIGHAAGLLAAVLTGNFSGAWAAIVGMFNAACTALIAILGGLFAPFRRIGIALMEGLVAGIRAGFAIVKATIGEVANLLPDTVRKVLGIHSPSRVFASLGGFVMAGLDQGLAANTSAPIARITSLAGQMTRALAVGAGGAAMASAVPAVASAGAAQPPAAIASAPATYHLHFHGVTGDPQDIADAVRRALEQIERDRRGRGFGDDGG